MKQQYLNRLYNFHLGPGDHPNGSSQEVHAGDDAGAGVQNPKWGTNAMVLDGETVAQGKIGLGKGRWAVVKDNGDLGSNYHDKPEDAIAESRKWQMQQESYNEFKKTRDSALARAKASPDLAPADISIITGRKSGIITDQNAIGLVRELGVRWTDAKHIVEHTPSSGISWSGSALRNYADVLKSYHAWKASR